MILGHCFDISVTNMIILLRLLTFYNPFCRFLIKIRVIDNSESATLVMFDREVCALSYSLSGTPSITSEKFNRKKLFGLVLCCQILVSWSGNL
jgi:hypothetical protein